MIPDKYEEEQTKGPCDALRIPSPAARTPFTASLRFSSRLFSPRWDSWGAGNDG